MQLSSRIGPCRARGCEPCSSRFHTLVVIRLRAISGCFGQPLEVPAEPFRHDRLRGQQAPTWRLGQSARRVRRVAPRDGDASCGQPHPGLCVAALPASLPLPALFAVGDSYDLFGRSVTALGADRVSPGSFCSTVRADTVRLGARLHGPLPSLLPLPPPVSLAFWRPSGGATRAIWNTADTTPRQTSTPHAVSSPIYDSWRKVWLTGARRARPYRREGPGGQVRDGCHRVRASSRGPFHRR